MLCVCETRVEKNQINKKQENGGKESVLTVFNIISYIDLMFKLWNTDACYVDLTFEQ